MDECSSHVPGVPGQLISVRSLSSGKAIPRSAAVRARLAGGVANHITVVTTIISMTTETRLCQRRLCCGTG
jgi:hypothetical protein